MLQLFVGAIVIRSRLKSLGFMNCLRSLGFVGGNDDSRCFFFCIYIGWFAELDVAGLAVSKVYIVC